MEAKIKRNIIILIVLTFVLLVGMSAGWFFVLVRPQKEAIEKTTTAITTHKETAGKLAGNLERRQKADDRLGYTKEQVKFFQSRYYTFNFGDVNNADAKIKQREQNEVWLRLMKEFSRDFGVAIGEQLKAAATAQPSVLILTKVKIIDPPAIPENIVVPGNGFMKPAGTMEVAVTGSFQSILAFLQRINEYPGPGKRTILLVVSNIKLSGTSPFIVATFSVTPYLIGRGQAVDFKAATAVGAAVAPPKPDPGN